MYFNADKIEQLENSAELHSYSEAWTSVSLGILSLP